MSDQKRMMSRRGMLKLSGLAPMIALTNCALQSPTLANIAAAKKAAKYEPPPKQYALVKKDVEEKLPKEKVEKFMLIASILWNHFRYGVDAHGDGEILVPKANDIFYRGYTYKSGAAIRKNIDKIADSGIDGQTNYCAYVCGHHAYDEVFGSTKIVTQTVFEGAWEKTKKDFDERFKMALKYSKKKTPPDLGYACN